MFCGKANVRYAPDIVLSGIWEDFQQQMKRNNSVVISVIDLERRPELCFATADYEQLIADIVKHHLKIGDHVVLAAFCEFEGDVEACKRIKKLCGKDDVETAVYTGWDFLTTFVKAKKIYGTRFHSVILAMYYNIPCIPFIYSKKTYDALVSYGISFDVVNLKNLPEYLPKDIVDSCGISNIDLEIKRLAKKQFEEVK